MTGYTTRQAARKLGISMMSMNRYIAAKKIPVPEVKNLGGLKFRTWFEEDIERVRKLLPKIKNGRKTRYQKKQSAISNQQSVKAKSKKK